MNSKRFCLEVTGDFACFTRPEMKVERVSYDAITPSAARAVFEAIFWKPAITWQVRRIEVLEPIRWVNLRRNEVASKVPITSVQRAMREGHGDLGLFIEDDRQQRAGLFLRDVGYRLHADMVVSERRHDPAPPAKFFAMFERRAEAGQCVNQPYLGCREFAAHSVRLVKQPTKERPALAEDRDLGWMLHDLDFKRPSDPQPIFFRARMQQGLIECDAREVTTANREGELT